ncbi:hypothetical protein HN592_02110 [Candidatus Woesearchaeota archaeon]|nr:hypothetical protein [Candidatus Woesearchaeota archaeon]MBT4368006.1 hypothetical protein [Candidatus Woesearchaeota archaeon]MBT4712494.1 hypothetical protein [Candidatus Woesearchaeota archaeon]MBT6639407.1 hypothetical protein [Candidatus Woesearchaeota archaeon]MBT7133579.1 hypothetical protein [Candidatus Woesearchaeota archaeon]
MNKVLILGGRGPKSFGRHAARILMQKGYRVFMSSTTQEGVNEINARDNPKLEGCLVRGSDHGDITIGLNDLHCILERDNPALVYDASQDRFLGDSIHVHHGIVCLLNGTPFLSEKPLCNTDNYGQQKLRELQQLNYPDQERLFGTHLPMVLVGDALMEDEVFAEQVLQADKIGCYWVTRGNTQGKVPIIDNLFLHTFPSLFGRHLDFDFEDAEVEERGDWGHAAFYATLRDIVYESQVPRIITCELHVQYGGNFTGFEFDGNLVGLHQYLKEGVPVVHPKWIVPCCPTTAMEQGNDGIIGSQIVAPISNPLEYTLEMSLRREPVVPLSESIRYQQNLQEVVDSE